MQLQGSQAFLQDVVTLLEVAKKLCCVRSRGKHCSFSKQCYLQGSDHGRQLVTFPSYSLCGGPILTFACHIRAYGVFSLSASFMLCSQSLCSSTLCYFSFSLTAFLTLVDPVSLSVCALVIFCYEHSTSTPSLKQHANFFQGYMH